MDSMESMHITVLYIWNIIICALIRVISKTLQVVI